MASARPRKNKNGEIIGYEIRVSRGRDLNGKQKTPYTMTWHLPDAWFTWTKKKQTKELEKAKAEFEIACQKGEVKTKQEIKADAMIQAKKEAEHMESELKKPTIQEAFDRFLIFSKNQKKTNTTTGYITTIKRFIDYVENKKIESVSQKDCEEYMEFLIYDGELATSTVRKHYATLSTFLKWCVSKRYIADNPLAEVPKPVDNSCEDASKSFSIEEINKIIECAQREELMHRILIYLLIDSGMRRGEIAGLRWIDVDLGSGRLQIVNNAQYTEGTGVYDTTTKSKKCRNILINDKVVEILKEWKEYQRDVVEGQGLSSPTHVLTHLDGERINPQLPTAYLRRFGEKYGIADCHPHKFRHTMATHMIQQGSDIKTVSEKLGHSSIEITLKLYTHSNEEAQKNANKKYSSLIWGDKKG